MHDLHGDKSKFVEKNLVSTPARVSYRLANLLSQIRPKHQSFTNKSEAAAEDELDILIRRAEEMRIQEQKGLNEISMF
jgi:hypothetical protein